MERLDGSECVYAVVMTVRAPMHTTDWRCSRRRLLVSGAALVAMPAAAAKLAVTPLVESRDGVTVSLRDLSPRFLDFYVAAQGLAPDARFAVWQDRYGFAAVPPTPKGEAVARRLLDAAWPRYEAALSTIRAGASAMQPRPLDVAVQVATLLEAPRPIKINVVAYVGGFEVNAFTAGGPDGPVVALPIEMEPSVRALTAPHEMTHAVHMIVGHLSPGYERSLGRVIFEEGLAMRTAQRLKPGLPDHAYVGDQSWFEAGIADRRAILSGLLPDLDRTDGATLFKYTMGDGATGREREAYIAAWLVVGQLLQQGMTLPALARVAEREMPPIVSKAIQSLS